MSPECVYVCVCAYVFSASQSVSLHDFVYTAIRHMGRGVSVRCSDSEDHQKKSGCDLLCRDVIYCILYKQLVPTK